MKRFEHGNFLVNTKGLLLASSLALPYATAFGGGLPIGQLNIKGDVHKVDCLSNNSDNAFRTIKSGLRGGEKTVKYRSSTDIPYNKTNWPWYASFEKESLVLPYGSTQVAAVVVDIRNINGVPHYAYFSNGTWNRLGQNYSSTKVVAELGAIHKIRLASNFKLGAGVRLSNYRWDKLVHGLHYRSINPPGEVFKQVAGLHNDNYLNATTFLRGWLARPSELFNGGYGAGLRNSSFTASNSQGSVKIDVVRQKITPNHITPLAMAEFWKRIGVNRRDDRLMPKGSNKVNRTLKQSEIGLIDSYRAQRSTGDQYQNRFAPSDIQERRTTITLNDLYHMMYGAVNTRANNRTHTNGMVWDGGVRGRFYSRDRFYDLTGGQGKIMGKTGSSKPRHSAFGGHVCIPDQNNPEQGREFAFFILGHGSSGVSSETVVKRSFAKIMKTFAGSRF